MFTQVILELHLRTLAPVLENKVLELPAAVIDVDVDVGDFVSDPFLPLERRVDGDAVQDRVQDVFSEAGARRVVSDANHQETDEHQLKGNPLC